MTDETTANGERSSGDTGGQGDRSTAGAGSDRESAASRAERRSLTRRQALAGLGAAAVPAAANASAFGSSTAVEWSEDRDARGHDLRDAGTVGANGVTVEELGGDRGGVFGSLAIDEADLGAVQTAARAPDRVVWEDGDGTFRADGPDGEVASGGDLLDVIQAAVDSLTAGRTWKETVLVVASGTIPDDASTVTATAGDRRALDLPSYTVLDVPGRLDFEAGDAVAVRATDQSHIEIPRLTVSGGPWMAVRLKSCRDVSIGHADVRYDADVDTNDAIRVDNDGDGDRGADVRIGSVYVENAGNHAVETYGIDRCQVGQVVGKDLGGVVVLLNETSDATVGGVVGYNPETPPSLATFRCANHCEGVTVGQVVSRDAPRGVHVITNSDDITIGEVDIVGARDRGIKIDRTVDNVSVQGGRVKNCTPVGVLVQGGSVSISGLRVTDDRPEHERTQEYGIHVTHTARHCQVVNNDVRRAGTEADIRVDPPADDARPTTTVSDNVGDGIAAGSVVLVSGADPAARVEGITQRRDVTLDLRASVIRGPSSDEPFAWDGYFEWNGDTSQWDLVVEWVTDPLENVEFEYVVDQPLANLGRVSGEIDSP